MEIVKQRVRHRARRHRSAQEWLAVMAPHLAVRLAVATRRSLRPTSRLRRAVIARTLCLQYEAANRRDFKPIEVFYAPDLECVYEHVKDLPLDLPARDRGPQAMRRWSDIWDEAWEDTRAVVEQVIDTSGDRMAAIIRVTGRGKASGAELEQELTEVFTLRDGRVVEFTVFANQRESLQLLASPS